jgi:protein disulfide-isomerase A6
MFPKDSLVKMLDHKTFKTAMKKNETSMVAFVAPWCGHCKNLVPEYSKAALGLYPLVPMYAVNCHAEKNKKFCAEQGVEGFPTIKLFPRGKSLPPMPYNEERSASALYYFATRRIPKHVDKLYYVEDIPKWVSDSSRTSKHRALLLTKEKKMPLLWQVLGNKYAGTDLAFASHRDKKGKSSVKLGYEVGGKKEAKVLLYPAGSETPLFYKGVNKFESLSKFFDSVLDGTVDLSELAEETKNEEYVEDESEAEIARKQEAQRIALMHGGFTDIIDFEKAMLEGGANYHDSAGYGGMMGSVPEHLKKKKEDVPLTPAASMGSAPITGQPSTATPTPTPGSTKLASSGTCDSDPLGEKGDCQPPAERLKDEL